MKGFLHAWSRLWPALLFAVAPPASGQQSGGAGSIFGLVTEADSGNAITNVAVNIVGNPQRGVSGSDGRYSILLVPAGFYEVSFSQPDYERQIVREVKVVAGEATELNVSLRLPMFELELMEVMADPLGGFDSTLILERQEDPVFKNAIGSQMISQLGIGDAAEAVGKITGASVADGKYAVIRGLGDRYTTTMLNGTDFPSADPNRKAAQLDLIPSQFIGQLDVSKTFTPDLPGGFAGGAINIVTKRYPDEFLFNLSVGTSYNTQSSLRNDFLQSSHGSTDWLAMDDGTRELSDVAASTPPNYSRSLGDPIKSSFGSRQFSPVGGSSPVDSSFSLAIGDSQKVAGHKLGYLAGVSYKNEWDLYTDGRVRKYDSGGSAITEDKQDMRGKIDYTWGAMVALAYDLNDDHQIGFNVLRVQTAEDDARLLRGMNEASGADPERGIYLQQSQLAWTERSLTYYQLLGDHEFPALNGTKLNWVGALSTTTQDEPDLRTFQFVADTRNSSYSPFGPTQPERPNRTWRNIVEDVKSIKADITVPIPSYSELDNDVKLGGAYSTSARDFDARSFELRSRGQNSFYTSGDPNEFLSPANEPYTDYYNYSQNFTYAGSQDIIGSYLMGDWGALNWLRLVGGVRMERTRIAVDTVNLSSGQRYSAALDQTDFLPSLSTTIFIRTNLQLRAAWSQTLVRPIYREISRAPLYDVALGRTIQGNEGTRIGTSENMDLRLEWYPRRGSLISGSVFHKKITDPIELIQISKNPDRYQYTNYSRGTVEGVEFEMRGDLGNWWEPLTHFNLGFNCAFIDSQVELLGFEKTLRARYGETKDTRPLYDQPNYVINGDLTWSYPDWGTTITVSGGVVGERLVAVGTFAPDEYLQPAPNLDVFYTQRIGKRWKAKFSVKNLFDPAQERDQKWPLAGPLPMSTYKKGITFGLSLGFEY